MITNKINKAYNVVWVVNGKVKETIEYNKPIALAKALAKKYATTTHKTGKVIAVMQ